jgi:hypothetical protein
MDDDWFVGDATDAESDGVGTFKYLMVAMP